MKRCAMAVLGLLLLGGGSLEGGEPRQIEVGWGDLWPHVEGRKVALVLPDGTSVEGKVRAVDPDGLRMKVTRTSDRRALAKGERTIPRQAVSFLSVTQYRKLGRVLVTTGALAAAGIIVGTNYPDLYEGAVLVAVPAVIAAGMAGVAAAGYYTGKALDKRVVEIRIARNIGTRSGDAIGSAVQ